MGKIYAIGDIHGSDDKLFTLMEKIPLNVDHDTLVFIGDYIDRGKNSFEVVDYLIDLKKKVKHAVFLKGNHEEMLYSYINGLDMISFLKNGGQQTLDSYFKHCQPDSDLFPKDHLEFFNSLVLYHETEQFIFVHAGLRDQIPLHEQSPDDLLWMRKQFIYSSYNFGKRVIFGHTPFLSPLIQDNKIGIDTGAVYGNKLTCVKLPDVEFFSV